MAAIFKKLALMIVGNLVAWGIASAVENRMDGKDPMGRELPPKKKTYVDWKGNVVLGTGDFKVD